MLRGKWHSGFAVLTALSLSTSVALPLLTLEQPAVAQRFDDERFGDDRFDDRFDDERPTRWIVGRVEAGTSVMVVEPNRKKIILTPDEKVDVTLVTREPMRAASGTVLIPRGTKVEGEFRPAQGGTQFVARRLLLNDGSTVRLAATSNVVDNRQNVSKGSNTDPIWQGALVGGAASAIISSIVAKPGVFKTLAGAGAGALAGWLIGGRGKKSEVIVVRPKDALTLTLDSDLVLRDRG
jgi:hypothetical protein